MRLTAEPPAHERDDTPTKQPDLTVAHDDIYRVYFHGPAYQVLDEGWQYDGGAVGRFAADLPAGHLPETDPTTTEPRLAELCFQTAGLWEIGETGQMSLPAHADLIVTVGQAAARRAAVRCRASHERRWFRLPRRGLERRCPCPYGRLPYGAKRALCLMTC